MPPPSSPPVPPAAIVKNKAFPQSGRLRVNMGNIYFEQKKYPIAIKMYRMALDQIPATAKEIRFKIMRNIGLAFVRMGQYQDAFQAFSTVMDNVPDHQVCVREGGRGGPGQATSWVWGGGGGRG